MLWNKVFLQNTKNLICIFGGQEWGGRKPEHENFDFNHMFLLTWRPGQSFWELCLGLMLPSCQTSFLSTDPVRWAGWPSEPSGQGASRDTTFLLPVFMLPLHVPATLLQCCLKDYVNEFPFKFLPSESRPSSRASCGLSPPLPPSQDSLLPSLPILHILLSHSEGVVLEMPLVQRLHI